MTVKELRELLMNYPEDANVFVLRERETGMFGGRMMDVGLSWSIDQDTAEGALCLYPKEELDLGKS